MAFDKENWAPSDWRAFFVYSDNFLYNLGLHESKWVNLQNPEKKLKLIYYNMQGNIIFIDFYECV